MHKHLKQTQLEISAKEKRSNPRKDADFKIFTRVWTTDHFSTMLVEYAWTAETSMFQPLQGSSFAKHYFSFDPLMFMRGKSLETFIICEE